MVESSSFPIDAINYVVGAVNAAVGDATGGWTDDLVWDATDNASASEATRAVESFIKLHVPLVKENP